MDKDVIQLIGGPCGQHGPYTFYKAFKYTKDGTKRIMTLSEFFFVKLWMDSDLVCIGELQLLWIDKNSEQVLASLRLYFLPENTPEGRMDHGEDEVLAISEKVVLRVEDLITWITVDAEWTWGKLGKTCTSTGDKDICSLPALSESSLDFSDVEKERRTLSICDNKGPSVIILSYPRYCRYRSVMKRLEGVEDKFLKHKLVNALGGFSVPTTNTRILFCRDTFDYPELEGHELLCNHLAPKLKGRPRGKRKKRSLSPGSESNESECSVSTVVVACASTSKIIDETYVNGYRKESTTISTRRTTRSSDCSEGKAFLKKLTSFFKTNHTPLGRIPSLGYKELDLYAFYTKVQKLGGYDVVTSNRLWKSIFDDLGGNHTSTSAATVIRRHYERFLLPYERHVKGEEYKPLPVSERRRLKNKVNRNSVSDAETSEGTSGSDNSTPMPQTMVPTNSQSAFITASGTTENKDNPDKVKTSSLRSVRVKSERLKEAGKSKTETAQKELTLENNVPSKTETEKEDVKPKLLMLPEKKENEPTTNALTPVQKIPPEESLSPVESKEIPIVEVKDEKQNQVEIIEIPPKNETTYKDVIQLNSTDVYKTITSISSKSTVRETITTEVKKQKLDILKQGGLEVTPVRNVSTGIRKETRPSVIQTAMTHRVEIIPNDVKMDDKKQMPPPSLATVTKRPVHVHPVIPAVPTPITSKSFHANKTYAYNARSPPKVLQSKSIYAPSEETIYGDPKDIFQPTIQNIQTPKYVDNVRHQQTGGGILDLTVKSPQKPSVQITQIPAYNVRNTNLVIPSPLGLLDNRKVGSNLEITLVGNKMRNNTNNHINNKYNSKNRLMYNPSTLDTHEYKAPQKRPYTDNYKNSKLQKVEDKIRNTIYSTQMYPPREMKKNDYETNANKQYKMENVPVKAHAPPTPHKQPFLPPPAAMFNMPSYMSSVGKNVPPFMHVDPSLYYLQSMYPPLSMPPMSLMPTPDSLQFYTEILAQNATRSRMPFPFAQDGSSMTSTDNMKK